MRHLVIGMGSIGKRHYRLLQEAGETVVGVDIGEPRDWDVDMVWICTPTDGHYYIALDAYAKDISRIFIEKPVCDSLEKANRLKETGARIWVAQNMRFHPGAVDIRENLHKIGKIHYARLHFQHALANQAPGRIVKEGIVMDCIQWIDLALWLFGPSNPGCHVAPSDKSDKVARIYCEHENDVSSFIDLDFLRQDKSCGVEVIGEKGTLEWTSFSKNPESFTVVCQDKTSAEFLVHGDLFPDFTYREQLKYLLKDQWQSNINEAMASLKVVLG